MLYPRKIYKDLKKHLANRQVTVLTGMRRTGKTTLVKQLLLEIKSSNKAYFDLEKVDNRDLFFQKNYDNILLDLEQKGIDSKKKIFLALDEIQLLPEITSVVKYLYDHYDIKFIVTGSSSYYLKNLFTESLAGRKKIFELSPLDFGEFLTFRNIPFKETKFLENRFSQYEYERTRVYYEEYIRFGGFPEAVLEKSARRKKNILTDIISSYVNIDIKTLADFRRDKEIYILIKLLAGRIGTRVDFAKLSRLSGLSKMTVRNYIDFFEKTYLISLVPVFTRNIDREIVKAEKIYFCDNGLLGILADTSSGSKFENTVFNQLRHHGGIRYWSLKNGREIDFILDKKTALETKETPTDSDQKNLAKLAKLTGLKKFRLIGRHSSPTFEDYVWGGDIR